MGTESLQQRFESWRIEPERRKPAALPLGRLSKRHTRVIAFMSLLGALVAIYFYGGFARLAPGLGSVIDAGARQAGLVVREIRIEGSDRVNTSEIESVLGFAKGDLLLDLDIATTRRNIRSLSWVKNAAISRQLPDVVLIQVTERRPFALWQHDGQVWLIDRDGIAITADDLGQFSELPYIVGRGAPEAAAELIGLLMTEPDLVKRVSALIRVGDRRWDIEFDTGARLRLPERGHDYGPRTAWSRFAAIQRDHGLLSREVASFDMRLPDRLVMQATPEGLKTLARRDRGT